MKNIYFQILLSLCILASCDIKEEKGRYDTLVKEHSSLVNNNDSIIFGLVINEPKEIAMTKLYTKGLYSELGFQEYQFNSSNENIRDLVWDIVPKFYNDSLVGISLRTNTYDFLVSKITNLLVELYKNKYEEHCLYNNVHYFFYNSTVIEISFSKPVIKGGNYYIHLDYDKIN